MLPMNRTHLSLDMRTAEPTMGVIASELRRSSIET
jgi:hypothetical protein